MNLFSEALPVKVDFGDSLLILVIGMATIFTALIVLILTVNGCSLFFKLANKKKKAKSEVKVETVTVSNNSNEEEIVAAIMAAITAVYAQESDDGDIPPFRIKSIIRK